jgi:hypothetical protein
VCQLGNISNVNNFTILKDLLNNFPWMLVIKRHTQKKKKFWHCWHNISDCSFDMPIFKKSKLGIVTHSCAKINQDLISEYSITKVSGNQYGIKISSLENITLV